MTKEFRVKLSEALILGTVSIFGALLHFEEMFTPSNDMEKLLNSIRI